MRIVIDMQCAQYDYFTARRAERYWLSLAEAMVLNRGNHEIFLALSGLYPETIQPIRAAFVGLLPQENIRVWYAPSPVSERDPENKSRREVAELIREAFLASLDPEVVFVPSFFEGFESDVVTSVSLFADRLMTVVAIDQNDVINVENMNKNLFMLRKLAYLRRTDLVLQLFARNQSEVEQLLGVSKERIKTCLIFDDLGNNVQDVSTDAKNILSIFAQLKPVTSTAFSSSSKLRPKMAYISPLPPERSGISDYSAELLPELAHFYDIDVIVNQDKITTPWITDNCGIRSVSWFLENSHRYSRVLYHFGNSHFHQHMFDLLEQVPGVVVLHDFYLGDAQWYCEVHSIRPHAWIRSLYKSHCYGALVDFSSCDNNIEVIRKYPVNLEVLLGATGVIVHSEHSRNLADGWYGSKFSADWAVIPLLRIPSSDNDRYLARQELGFKSDDFVVCCFGLLGATKLNQQLLEAWVNSRLALDASCFLVFVGENDSGDYGANLVKLIKTRGLIQSVRITGWVGTEVFKKYLVAADIAVQLRANSRGETSAAVLDCLNYSLPTIINANGSMAELPSDCVWMLPDLFEETQLINALEILRLDDKKRTTLAKNAHEYVLTRHNPQTCAEQYVTFIERIYEHTASNSYALLKAIAGVAGHTPTNAECIDIAQAVSRTLPILKPVKQLLIDVSVICKNDLKTGIQRVVRALVAELIQAPPDGYRIEPVYLAYSEGAWNYRYANSWVLNEFDIPNGWIGDEPIDYFVGDLMFVADFTGNLVVEAERAGVFKRLKNDGISLHFLIYDLLPIQMPQNFPPNSISFHEWLNTVGRVADSAVCISSTVAKELRLWLEVATPQRFLPMNINWFHLGADVENSMPTRGMPEDAEIKLAMIQARPSFIMVGTIEPRKGCLETLEAFAQLWLDDIDINLVVVGKEGWAGLPDKDRRTIPQIVKMLNNHPEVGNRLFWVKDASDEFLAKIYAVSTCLIAASEGEGFGLPLIEAAQHKLPIIARDIPVFREVAEDYAYYFSGKEADGLAAAIKSWLTLFDENQHPSSLAMPWLTWKESAGRLKEILIGNNSF